MQHKCLLQGLHFNFGFSSLQYTGRRQLPVKHICRKLIFCNIFLIYDRILLYCTNNYKAHKASNNTELEVPINFEF